MGWETIAFSTVVLAWDVRSDVGRSDFVSRGLEDCCSKGQGNCDII